MKASCDGEQMKPGSVHCISVLRDKLSLDQHPVMWRAKEQLPNQHTSWHRQIKSPIMPALYSRLPESIPAAVPGVLSQNSLS